MLSSPAMNIPDELSPPPTLDLDLLRSYVSVVAHGSFAGAAVQLGCSQSAVSQQMQKLEALVQVPIFQKEGRSKQLTDPGRQLLRYARDLLALNDDAMSALRQRRGTGLLRIGSPHDVADTILPQILSLLARFMPELRLETTVRRSPALMDGLHRGELDMVMSTRQDAALEGFVLRRSPAVWLCASHFVLSPRQPVPLILGDESSIFRRFALDALERRQIPWRPVHSSASPLGVRAALRAGLGVTVRSMELVSPDVRILGERDGFPRLPEIQYFLWRRPHTLNPLVQRAFKLLRESQRAYGGPQATAAGKPPVP